MDFSIVKKIFFDLFKFDSINLPKADVLTFACDNDRYLNIGGKKYSPLINTIEDDLARSGLQAVSITRIASVIKGDLSHGRVFSPEGDFARAMLIKRIKGIFFGRGEYPFSFMEEKIWGNILDSTEVKAVVAILPSRELCSACRKRNIWVVDIQHGVIADEHYWYGEKFRSSDPIEWLPNEFAVWDEGAHKVINKWAASHNDVAVRIIGNPWVYRFRDYSDNDLIVGGIAKKYSFENNNKKNILISLSWGGHGLENGFIHSELEVFIAKNLDKYNWRIRLHPNQVQGFATDEGVKFIKYFQSKFGDKLMEWRESTDMPLPLLLSNTDLHITWISSVCMEASYFGIRSLVLCPELLPGGKFESYYNYLVCEGYVEKKLPELEGIEKWFLQNENLDKMKYYSDYSLEYKKFINKIAGFLCN